MVPLRGPGRRDPAHPRRRAAGRGGAVDAGRSLGGHGRDLGRPDHLLRQRRRVQRARLAEQRAFGQQPGAAGRHRRLRRAAAGRRPRHPAVDASDPHRLGRRRRAGGDRGGHRHRAVRHRHRLDRGAGRRRDPLRPAIAGDDRGRGRRAADGSGGQGGAACDRAGSARPAAALLGRSPGAAQWRSHHGVPVLALSARLRAGLGRRPRRLGSRARRRGGCGGLRPRPVAVAVRQPGGPAVRRRVALRDAMGRRSAGARRLLVRSARRCPMPASPWASPWPMDTCCSPARPAIPGWPARLPARGSADRMRHASRRDQRRDKEETTP